MMYKAICEWRDLTDGHAYSVGDVFPYDGRKIEETRLTELLGDQNKAHKSLIERVEGSDDKIHEQEEKQRKRAVKTPKTEE